MEQKNITNNILKKIMKKYVFIFESLRERNKYYIIYFLHNNFINFTIKNEKILGISYGNYEIFSNYENVGYTYKYNKIFNDFSQELSRFNNSNHSIAIKKGISVNVDKIYFYKNKPTILFLRNRDSFLNEGNIIKKSLNTKLFNELYYDSDYISHRPCTFKKKEIFKNFLKDKNFK